VSITLPVDAEKLGSAISNLLSNAIRYSPFGGTVRLVLGESDRHIFLEVHDEGPGVAEADRAHVFEPFFRGARQPDDAVRGTGIGLSIVTEYVCAHGGKVELIADNGTSYFRIELPYAHP
jgi:two-component system sensor histidine kinase GlrK